MKKSEGKIKILKTVVVASASIAATFAIIIGVTNYSNSKRKNVGKETESTTLSKETKSIDSKEYVDFIQVFPKSYMGEAPIKIGNYVFAFSQKGVGVKSKDEKEYNDLPDVYYTGDFDVYSGIYSNGEYVYYCEKQYLYKYNLKTKKADKIKVFECGGEGNYREDNKLSVVAGKKGYIYMDCEHDYETNIYVYNFNNNEVETIPDKFLDIDLGDYMVCEELGSRSTDESIRKDTVGYSIYKYTEDGLEKVRTLISSKENISCDDMKFYYSKIEKNEGLPEYSWLVNDKLHIGIYEKESELTLYTFDVNTEEYKKNGILKASDLGYKDGKQTIEIKSVYDDHYLVAIGDVDNETDELDGEYDGFVYYNYNFITKKYEIKKMSE